MSVVLVIGASRGLGLEFVRQYIEAGDRVIATVRDAAGRARVQALGAEVLTVDVSQPASAAWQLDGEKIDTARYVAGVCDPGAALSPPTRELFDALSATLSMLTAAHKGQFLHHDGCRFAGW
jgi:NAD(P)-dependent dehydrogenase (short-subunit alcohol dehydrogenase family)